MELQEMISHYKRIGSVGDFAGVAVFEPIAYNPDQHTPSPIFVREIKTDGQLPDGWLVFPEFSRKRGKNIACFDTGDADLYGMGESMTDLRRNDDWQILWNTENPTGFLKKGRMLYQSHPWVLGVRKDGSSFGIIADTCWESEIGTKGGVHFKSKGPAFRVIVIDKENPSEVIRTLADLTGKMEMPPLWALGYHQCRYSYYPQEVAAGIADALRSHRIPCDVVWMDIHYMDHFKVFTFNPEGFSKVEELNEHLHEKNLKAVYMIDPGVKAEKGYSVDDSGRAGDFFVKKKNGSIFHGKVWPGECHFPDFTKPGTCRWWAGLYEDFMARGIDGVWNDMNEPSVMSDFGATISRDAVHEGGGEYPSGIHGRYHNIYGYLMARATREGVMAANPGKRPFVLSRSNFLGGQRYAAMWTGDNFSDYSQMKISIPMCLNIGLSGQPFNGADIGGFIRDCTPELLRHWTASGIYFPFARNHSMNGTVNQEPWAFDVETENICRTAIERRYRLLPYYYTLFEEASRTGLPVMRPLFWSDFKDCSLRTEQQAYMIGDHLMVIPRWSENPALPEGGWNLFSFENSDDGYQAYLALRQGSAIPITDIIQSTVEYNPSDVTVLVNPDADGKADGVLYVDAGEGYGYNQGEFARLELIAEVKDGSVRVEMRRIEGQMSFSGRIRIAVICGGNLKYSPWYEGNVACIAAVPDAGCLNREDLRTTPVRDFSVSKGYTKISLTVETIVSEIKSHK